MDMNSMNMFERLFFQALRIRLVEERISDPALADLYRRD